MVSSGFCFNRVMGINKHTTRATAACLMTCTGTVVPVASSVAHSVQRAASSIKDARYAVKHTAHRRNLQATSRHRRARLAAGAYSHN